MGRRALHLSSTCVWYRLLLTRCGAEVYFAAGSIASTSLLSSSCDDPFALAYTSPASACSSYKLLQAFSWISTGNCELSFARTADDSVLIAVLSSVVIPICIIMLRNCSRPKGQQRLARPRPRLRLVHPLQPTRKPRRALQHRYPRRPTAASTSADDPRLKITLRARLHRRAPLRYPVWHATI